jgi:hypothetical protein
MQKTLRILILCTLVLSSSAAYPAQYSDIGGSAFLYYLVQQQVHPGQFSDIGGSAFRVSAFDMLKLCESENSTDNLSCLFFIGGVQSSTQRSSALNPNTPFAICLPGEVTWGQSMKMFIKFANEHPNLLPSHAATVMDMMYRESFPIGPCSKE